MKRKNKILTFGVLLCMLFAMVVVPVSAATGGNCGGKFGMDT